MKLKFSGHGLAFLANFCAKKGLRHYLKGVCFTPLPKEAGGGVLGAATNGHVLGLWHDAAGAADRKVIAVVTRPLITACKKPDTTVQNIGGRLTCIQHKKKDGLNFELHVQPNPKAIEQLFGSLERWEIDGAFPALDRVIPSQRHFIGGVSGSISAKYMGLVQKAVSDAGADPACAITMRQHDDDGAILLTFDDIYEATAVVMPCRLTNPTDRPWLQKWCAWRDGQKQTAPLPVHEPSDATPPSDHA